MHGAVHVGWRSRCCECMRWGSGRLAVGAAPRTAILWLGAAPLNGGRFAFQVTQLAIMFNAPQHCHQPWGQLSSVRSTHVTHRLHSPLLLLRANTTTTTHGTAATPVLQSARLSSRSHPRLRPLRSRWRPRARAADCPDCRRMQWRCRLTQTVHPPRACVSWPCAPSCVHRTQR